jgi:hypothetical protein
MTQTPTVEQFLAEQSSELDVEAEHVDPLESIAESLRLMSFAVAGMVTDGEPLTAELVTGADEEARWHQEYDDLYEKYNELFGLVADIEKVVKKSTSQVSLAVKDAIEAWKNPAVPAEPEETVEPEAAVDADARPEQPAHDADVETWRAYCRALRPAEFLPTTLDTMNRSQIRTFLGIEQVEA